MHFLTMIRGWHTWGGGRGGGAGGHFLDCHDDLHNYVMVLEKRDLIAQKFKKELLVSF